MIKPDKPANEALRLEALYRYRILDSEREKSFDDLVVIAGLLVGVGTRYGSGCTSGHGVCGLSRMSPRSLVATLAFMGAGFVTVFLIRHVLA